jgi:hypothetical protein
LRVKFVGFVISRVTRELAGEQEDAVGRRSINRIKLNGCGIVELER